VVRDLYETETASFWKDAPEIKNGTLKTADIQTEVFFLPAAAVAEARAVSPTRSGSCSGTTGVDPPTTLVPTSGSPSTSG